MEKAITEINKGLIDQAINSLNWDEVLKFYKVLGYKIGTQQLKVEGITKKTKLTPEASSEEVRKLIEYIIYNDIPELSYGPWSILWVNGEWEIEVEGDENNEPLMIPLLESKLQVFFIPQSTTVTELLENTVVESTGDLELDEEIFYYETKLKKAIDNQDYMIASKLRDLIEELKK